MFRKIFICALLIVFILGIPYALVALLDSDLINFKLGSNNTWITFWGSYIGAIVSASAVYFVARFQIKKQYDQQMELFKLQNKQQIQSIEMENKHSTKREMKKFYLINKLEKIEEMQVLLDKLSSINIGLNNELVEFSVIKLTENKGLKGNRDVDHGNEMYRLRTGLSKYRFEINEAAMRLSVLSNYIERAKPLIFHLQQNFVELLEEVNNCFYSDEGHTKYLTDKPGEFSTESSKEIKKIIIEISFNTLQEEMKDIIKEIEEYAS
ncbi:hypothetical protein [Oceanobacillus sp. FSL W7-1293]|uniref:hypothetical protein n=1 Tax=Oceanobacillus sp. FSL W7-1293 TaxID=2921699 RepID=UPI0030CD8E25